MLTYQRLGISERDYNDLKLKFDNKINHINKTVIKSNYKQEDGYFIAYFAKLDRITFGVDKQYYIEFKSSKVTDKSSNSREITTGCDFGLEVIWKNSIKEEITNEASWKEDPFKEDNWQKDPKLRKAIVGQAKNKINLSTTEKRNLEEQLMKMQGLKVSYVVMFRCENDKGIIVQIGEDESLNETPIPLSEYIIDYFLACLHGVTDPNLVEKMLKSDLDFRVKITSNLPKPKPKPKPKPTSDLGPESRTKRKPRM